MKNEKLAQRIKTLRIRQGFSQEELSEKTGLSLRTIQRVENGETEPRGDSLKRLAYAFNVSSDEIVDWTVQEDKGFLTSLNLSALSFIIFPILGILVPLIIWISKKDKIKNANKISKDILNFQITWTMILFSAYLMFFISAIFNIKLGGNNQIGFISNSEIFIVLFPALMYLYNLIFVIVNSVRIYKGLNTVYHPKIRFLRK